MNKLNFNGLKNIKTPDGWTEKAILIPQRSKAAVPYRVSPLRSVMIAASFVLVTVLSVSAFLIFGNRNSVPVASSPTTNAQATQAPTKQNVIVEATETAATEQTTSADTKELPTEKETQISTDAQGNTVITTVTTIITTVDGAPDEPEETPTAAAQTEQETGQEQEPQPATQSDIGDADLIIEAVYFPRSSGPEPFEAGGAVQNDDLIIIGYCLIYDEDGTLLGESYPFHSQHFANIKKTDHDRYLISYSPTKHDLSLHPGRYRYILLDENQYEITAGWLDIS